MKTKITALTLAAVTALSLVPKPAKASDEGWAIAGGIIGGILIGAAIADSRSSTYCPPAPVAYCPPVPVYYPPVAPAVIVPNPGYWNNVSVKVWVPAGWVVERDYRGCDVRRYVAGHYTYRTNRVWVASNNRHDSRGGYDSRNGRGSHNDRNSRDGRDSRSGRGR